jgi:sugar phosphate isomerase/epimerase
MGTFGVEFTVFTKPWKTPLPELGRHIRGLGFDGIELPVRPGYQVEPDNVAKGLPAAAKLLADFGLKIGTVAGPTDERTIAACAEAGVPIIRICVAIPPRKDYLSAIADCQREWEALVPVLDRHGVALGIQNHFGRSIANSAQLLHAVGRFDPRHVCIVWDAAHTALQGEDADISLDIIWSHLRVANLKSAYWKRSSGPEAPVAKWTTYWTTGRHGLANWPTVAAELRKRDFAGDICLTAEYTDHDSVDRMIAEDIAFAKSLFAPAK